MSIKDIIKNSILEEFNRAEVSNVSMLTCLICAALLGIFIYLVYRIVTTNTFYSKTFNMSLMLLCVITSAIILTVQNSVIVSLGMVVHFYLKLYSLHNAYLEKEVRLRLQTPLKSSKITAGRKSSYFTSKRCICSGVMPLPGSLGSKNRRLLEDVINRSKVILTFPTGYIYGVRIYISCWEC